MTTLTQEKTPQKQHKQPGIEAEMHPEPQYIKETYLPSGKLKGKVALVTGGDSGTGRSVCVHFAEEGADIAIVYLNEDRDAEKTRDLVAIAGIVLLVEGDHLSPRSCVRPRQNRPDSAGCAGRDAEALRVPAR